MSTINIDKLPQIHNQSIKNIQRLSEENNLSRTDFMYIHEQAGAYSYQCKFLFRQNVSVKYISYLERCIESTSLDDILILIREKPGYYPVAYFFKVLRVEYNNV
jgi:hypothetical protein